MYYPSEQVVHVLISEYNSIADVVCDDKRRVTSIGE